MHLPIIESCEAGNLILVVIAFAAYISISCTVSMFKAQKALQREKNLEEAKKVTIEEDKSLPQATQVHCTSM